MFYGKAGEVRPVVGFGFAEQIADVFFNGAGAEVEADTNITIGEAMGEEFEDLLFSFCEVIEIKTGHGVGF